MGSFHLSFDFSEGQSQQVLDGAKRILDDIGMLCPTDAGTSLLCSLPGIRANGTRVHVSPELVDQQIELLRKETPPDPDPPVSQGSCWCCLNLADTQRNCVRPAGEKDLARAVRLYEGMGIRGGPPPLVVSDVSPRARDFQSTRVCLEHSESFGHPTGLPPEEDIPFYADMFEAAGRGPVPVLAMLILTPLRFDERVVDFCILHREDPRLRIHPAAGMPCVGSTSPLHFPAAFSLALAEALATSLFVRICLNKIWFPHLRSDPLDFRTGNYVVGSAPYEMLDAVTRKIFQHLFGCPHRGGCFLSLARWPDAHAVHDHTLSALLQGLQGARHFGGSGQLSHDEVFSPEMVVIDRDILRSLEYLLKGMPWDEADLAMQVLKEGMASGQFMDHDTTLQGFRRLVVDMDLFRGMNLGQWRGAGERSLIEEAHRCVDKIVAERTFIPPPDAAKAIRAIARKATLLWES